MNRFSQEYLENKRQHLIARRESKLKILKEGGLRAELHSDEDIKHIDFTLKRIAEGQFGICPPCGGEIKEERLEFKPEMLRCKDCQDDFEKLINVH